MGRGAPHRAAYLAHAERTGTGDQPVEIRVPAFSSRRDPQISAARTGGQGSLALDTAPPPPKLTVGDFIQALNFPEDPDDTDGFRALRLALKAPQAAPLIRAAQDVLTLMSQNGLYMDDLEPDHPKPELWRRFAAGEARCCAARAMPRRMAGRG
ncbi:hypothetical protein [Mangrovicoccus ximenensis]|uniref:hypothetical protein n=1 Tax=Mangrovicoccus ximenensis TaxID=1911570 RepID=UPI0038B30701